MLDYIGMELQMDENYHVVAEKPRASEERSVLLTDKPSLLCYTLIKIKVFLIEILIQLRWPPES